jgi:hypothetical protein
MEIMNFSHDQNALPLHRKLFHSLPPLLMLVLVSCGGGAEDGPGEFLSNADSPDSASTGDTILPSVTINTPTDQNSLTSSSPTVTLKGTANDNEGVVQVSWANSLGGSGIASETNNWTVSAIALKDGTNELTVTAWDAAGNKGTDKLTVVYNAPGGSATLTWDASIESDLGGYRVYYGETSGSYDQAKGQGIVVNGTTYTVNDLKSGVRYYFAVTAYDFSGNESDYSREDFKDTP